MNASPSQATLFVLATFAVVLGAASAEQSAEPALPNAEEREELLKRPDYLTTLNDMAELYQAQGAYARAEPLLREVLEARKRLHGQPHRDYATALNNLGGLYQTLGDYARAEPLLREAMEINRTVLGPKHPDYATSINNLAGLHYQQGDYAAAKPLFEQALDIRRQVLPESDPDYATSLNNLAALYEAQGEPARAEACYRQALDIRRRALSARHPAYAASLNNLAALYRSQGDFARAEPLYTEALETRKQALGTAHPDYAASLNNLAVLYRSKQDYARAAPLYRQALEIQQGVLTQTFLILSERQQLAMVRLLRRTLNGYLTVTADVAGQEQDAYSQVLSWKGMVFAGQRQARRAAARPELAPLWTELQETSRRLAALILARPEPGQERSRQQELVECSRRKELLEAEFVRRSDQFRGGEQETTPDGLRSALPPGVALVDILEYTRITPRVKAVGDDAAESLVAFVTCRARPLVRVELGPAVPVRQAIEAWRRTYGGAGKGAEAGRELRTRLWTPIEKHLDGAAVVLISPDGELARLPWAALPGEKAGSYLLEDRSLALAPVPQSLPEVLAGATSGRTEDASLLLIGDVDYDAVGATGQAGPTSGPATDQRPAPRFARLENSRGEILSVRDSFESSFPDGRLRMLRARQATETAFRQEAPRHRFLHVATHGFFAPPDQPSLFGLDVSTDRRGKSLPAAKPTPAQQITALHPLLLSGLALAGANGPPAQGADDGILTAEEVATLDLSRVDLAVLSACETGLGAVAGGEGVLGLQRAMQVSGARTVAASLWKVSDQETRQLMEQFYQNLWTRKLGKLESLRQAQLAMLREGPSRGMALVGPTAPNAAGARAAPFYWAAFVLSGDWR